MSDIRLNKIGFVFQSFHLLPKQSALANVEMPLNYARVPKKERRERALKALDRVGLADRVDFKPNQLSGGQKQRFTIARALVRKPKVLILDDSASALDFATDAKLRKSLKQLGYRPTTFIVSQRTSSIQHADMILVLDDGKIVGNGTHDELLKTCEVYNEIYMSQFKDKKAEGEVTA